MRTGRIILACAQFGDYVESAFAGQHHVEEHGVEVFGLEPRQSRLAVAFNGGLVALGLQVIEESLGEVGLVFDDENAQGTAHQALNSRSWVVWRRRRGSWTLTVVPLPSPALSAKTSPPCWRAMERTMKSPRPVPLVRSTERAGTR